MAAKVKKSIVEISNGAILERADYELERIMANLNDPNTNPAKKRKLTIELTFNANDDRSMINISALVKSKLEATNPIKSTLFNIQETNSETGEVNTLLREAMDVCPGQLDINGNIHEPEIVLIGQSFIKNETVENLHESSNN